MSARAGHRPVFPGKKAAGFSPLRGPAGEKEADRLYPNAEKTASGLRYIVIRDGEGKSPGPRDIVTVDYEGCLLGTDSVFDSSYRRGEPLKFRVEQVIPGWQ